MTATAVTTAFTDAIDATVTAAADATVTTATVDATVTAATVDATDATARTVADFATVRSKNAGPFWLTVDFFCATADDFARVSAALSNARIARALHADELRLKRFEMPHLRALKISLPRPQVQGHHRDRDMHAAAYACILAELTV